MYVYFFPDNLQTRYAKQKECNNTELHQLHTSVNGPVQIRHKALNGVIHFSPLTYKSFGEKQLW